MLSDTKLRTLKPNDKPFKLADYDGLYIYVALLHKSPEGRVSPYPMRIYGIATVTGVPS